MKRCQAKDCSETTNLMVNSIRSNAAGEVIRNYICRPHNAERRRKYYQTETGKKAILKANVNWWEKQKATGERWTKQKENWLRVSKRNLAEINAKYK